MNQRDIILNSHNEELINYQEPDWPHSLLYTNVSKTLLGYIPLHWHVELQFTVVTKGMIELHISGEKIRLSEGSGCFINSGVVHEIHPKTSGASYICWNMGISLFDKHIQAIYILPLIQAKNSPFIILTSENARHIRILQAIFNSYEAYSNKNNGFELVITCQYLTCLSELLHEVDFSGNHQGPIYDQRIKRMLAYIHTNFQQKIKLETLAEIADLSQAETIRSFKRHVGRTPFKYILHYRLERSINLLVRTRSSITEIALECGFSSVSYFIEKFKETFHLTPRKYRDKNRQNNETDV